MCLVLRGCVEVWRWRGGLRVVWGLVEREVRGEGYCGLWLGLWVRVYIEWEKNGINTKPPLLHKLTKQLKTSVVMFEPP